VAITILTVGTGGTYSTIQAAVDAAGNGDRIEIAAGTYREQVTVNGKDITLQGAGGAARPSLRRPMRRRWSPTPRIPTVVGRTSLRSLRSRATPMSPSQA
jgi:hypothetical protein